MNTTDDAADRTAPPTKFLAAAAGFLLFVAYGSLVPLDFSPRPLLVAWGDFLGAQYRPFGLASRADWIANILLYMPPAYLLSAGLAAPRATAAARALSAGVAFLVCATVALGVEFAQLFFPPRTASLSDVVANCAGAALGIAVWGMWGDRLGRLLADTGRGGSASPRAALVLYALAYLVLSLFPFDFMFSAAEISRKLASGMFGVLVAPIACGRFAGCVAKGALEIAAVIPLGVLLGIARGRRAGGAYAAAIAIGLVLGLVLEVAQLFIASGVSQGVSLLTRAAGVACGVALHRHLRGRRLMALRPLLLPALLLAGVPYLFAMMWSNGWLSGPWGDLAQASSRLQQLHWAPFYYHYYTTETSALISVLSCAVLYLPVGAGCWLLQYGLGRRDERGSATLPAFGAAALAGIMETGKLFTRVGHPDPTNILIAAAAAAAGYRLARHFCAGVAAESATVGDEGSAPNAFIGSPAKLPAPAYALAVAGVVLAIGIVYRYPLSGSWLVFALVGYGYAIWRMPGVAVPVVVAALPLLNLSPWSGWVMLDEFDLLVLVTLGVGLCRGGAAPLGRGWPPPGAVFGLLALSYLVSAGLGLWPLSPWDANAFSSYYSHYNALRVAKGALWAFGLLWLLAVSIERGTDLRRPFTLGMVAGLAGTLAVVGWERLAFTGLFNFNHAHRVSGPFSALHVGGSSLEGYLVTALPFLGFAIVTTRHRALRLGGLLLFGAGIYGVMVTYSRAGFAALAVIGTLMGVALVRHGLRQAWDRRAYLALGLLFLAGAVTVATPLLRGNFAQERLAQSGLDLATRFAYWRNTLAIMDQGWPTRLFGMGLGRFPETYFWRSAVGTRPATYRFESENGNAFLRLGSGSPLFLNQIVPLQPHRRYSLALDLRTAPGQGATQVGIPICEKRVRQSFRCEEVTFKLDPAADNWQHREIVFDSKAVGSGPWYSRRPVTLSLNNSRGILDVDNIRLVDEDGHDLLANGGFDRGGARWWFSVDDNWPWHVENFWLHVYFEQGVLGLVGVAALAAMALTAALRRMWRGDLFAGSLFASIAGFLVVGILNSPNDNPQLLLLFLLLCGVACRITGTARSPFDAVAAATSRPSRKPATPGPEAALS